MSAHSATASSTNGRAARHDGDRAASEPAAEEQWARLGEAQFRDFAAIRSDLLWETNAEIRVVRLIGACEEVLGVPATQVLGKTPDDLAGGELETPGWTRHRETLSMRRSFRRFEHRLHDPAGNCRWLLSSGRPFFDPSGIFLGYRGITTDVTALRRAEEKLAQSARQQQAVATISQLALQGVSAAELYEIAAESIASTLAVDLVSILELSADKQVLRLRGGFGWPSNTVHLRAMPVAICRPLHEALSSSRTVFFKRRDFNIFPEDLHPDGVGMAVAIGDQSDRVGVLAICSGDRRRFEQGDTAFLQTVAFVLAAMSEQRKSEATLRLRDRSLAALDQGIMITDAGRFDQPLIYVNESFERLTGYSRDEVIGRNPRFLQGPQMDAEAASAIRGAVEGERTFRGVVMNCRKDGSTFWNDLSISPVRDSGGATTHFVGVLSDVTERVQLEAQLRQAQKMEAVGHLTGGVAHDFNNLLAVIVGNTEILAEEIADPDLKAMAELVMETAERGADLTQRLLAFGRRQPLRPEPIALDRAIGSFSGVLRRTLGEQITLEIRPADGLGEALVDRAQFESALLNLAVNARDAMPGGGVLTIGAAAAGEGGEALPAELASGSYVRVSIRDTGIGMTPEVLAHVFEPFFTTKDVGKGSGLGLAMVYGFAKQSGGHVTIESEPGIGTAVHLFLKLAPAGAAGFDHPAARKAAAPLGHETILLVEDEPEVRKFVSAQLAKLGYTVLDASAGAAALAILRSDAEIDLLFSDLILPGSMTGLQILDQARQVRPGLRAILTTGYTEEFAHFESAVRDPILRKPYKRHELADLLRRTLDESRPA